MRRDLELRYNLKTDKKTSERMKNIHLKRGKIEDAIALPLWHQGIHYRRNYKRLPGSPDIAITKYKIAVFADGEFWHGYDWENKKKRLKHNREYWINKIETNMKRDRRNDEKLRELGWTPLHFWERMIKNHSEYCIEMIKLYMK
ncbi:very short patch repair endonuclease [Lactobacillaceae bacterium Scapto_B20]